MSIFTRQFVSADEYEEWVRGAGERIHVLSVTNQAGKGIYKPQPRQLWIRNPGMPPIEQMAPAAQRSSAAITVKYQTSDPTLAPALNWKVIFVQAAMAAAVLLVVFMFLISRF